MKHLTLTLLFALGATLGAAAQGLVDKGLNAEAKGLDDLAEGYYRQATDTSLTARLRLGMLLERREHYNEAAQWLVQADSSSTAMAHLAAVRAELRLWPDAKQAAEKAVELAADNDGATRASAMGTLALFYCSEANYTNALTWVKKAAEEDAGSPRVKNIEGIILFRRGNINEAMRAFREALKADPQNADAHFNLGAMYCYRNNPDQAIATLRKGLKIHRQSVKLLYCLGWAFMLKDESEHAIESLEMAVGIDSGYTDAYNRLGDIYFGRAEYNRAIEQYRKSIRHAPHLTEGYRLLGRTYAEMKQYQKAITQYQKAVAIDKNDSETYLRIAELYGKQKQPAKEKANYRRAAKLGNAAAQKWCTKNGVTY